MIINTKAINAPIIKLKASEIKKDNTPFNASIIKKGEDIFL